VHKADNLLFSPSRRPVRKVTFVTAVVFEISNVQYIGKAVMYVHCSHRGAVEVENHSVLVSALDAGEW
jgi:hypothetical protein